MDQQHLIGIDFGTLSARALVVRAADGAELGTATCDYAHGVISHSLPGSDERLPAQWALQHPQDWLDAVAATVPAALADSGVDPATVVGVATDFTASSPMPVFADGRPLCSDERFAHRPHAWPKLWKHHAAGRQADRINALAAERGEPWLARYGGRLSSEWQFAKALQVLEEDPEVFDAAALWVEAADWIVWQLGGRLARNACTAGYKGVFQDGRYPAATFLEELHPGFGRLVDELLAGELHPLGGRAGSLTERSARLTGLSSGIAVAVGNVDAHVTAPAAMATGPGQLVAVMGTSTCHVMNATVAREVPGMCGLVDGGIVDGLLGYEAGQSGVGDILAWFVEHNVPGACERAASDAGASVHEHLTALAATQRPGQHGLLALDWHSGNRSVLVDHQLSGLVLGLTLDTRPEDIYRALIEATAFGARTIVDAFERAGVPVEDVVVAGGLLRNRLLMQIYADVLGRPLHVIGSAQGPALGSAIHAAVAAGVHPDVRAASEVMGRLERDAYVPDPVAADVYDELFVRYTALHDHFGRGGDDVMHALRGIGAKEAVDG